jgi:hypothetical protein
MRPFRFEVLPGSYGVARLDSDSPIPNWAPASPGFISITRTDLELSVVGPEDRLPSGPNVQRGFSCLRITGPIDFAEIGILAGITRVLAHAEVSVFAISTYDTDYLLVPGNDLERAVSALSADGHSVTSRGAA